MFKAFKITAKYLFRRKVTVQYPETKALRSNRFRGVPVFVEDSNNQKMCVSCGLCEKICPAKAIKLKNYDIDSMKCISCGLCEEICSIKAIYLTNKPFAIKEVSRDG